jgi:glycosyltransferase involved in cell wall biosynthesis
MLIPARRDAIAAMLGRIALEADAVIVDHPRLVTLFARPDVAVVQNGADDRLLATPISKPPQARAMAYAGTLSERLDTDLLRLLLAALPDSRLDLYGECRYKGGRDQPAPELRRLLTEFTGRVAWHGVVSREELASRLDAARVLLLPHRVIGAVGGDSMKLYDYAARGRPIVSTLWAGDLRETAPPGTYFADAPSQFADAVARAMEDDPGNAVLRRAWAETHSSASRWDAWSRAVFGPR